MKLVLLIFLMFVVDLNASSIGVYKFNDWDGPEINVFYAHPEVLNDKTRLVIVMHGRKRNAEQYRNQWIDNAKEKNLAIIVPEFNNVNFPEVYNYNYGSINPNGKSPSIGLNLFSLIKTLVENHINLMRIDTEKWGMYGHGAGGHFVHRYVLYQPEADFRFAIASNLGWYLNINDKEWPFGLKNSGINESDLRMALKKKFLILLGESDVSRKPNTAYAKENFDHISYQGEHRLARGKSFFKNAQNKATELDIIMNWNLMVVPTKDGHGNTKQMVPYAADILREKLK